ncbi:hypothetical protein VN97_g8101, partial [Penicillium thymicola]
MQAPLQFCHHIVGAYCCCLISGSIGCVTWLKSGPMHNVFHMRAATTSEPPPHPKR